MNSANTGNTSVVEEQISLEALELESLTTIRMRWENRGACFRTQSKNYQDLQRRFLPLLAIPADEREIEFECIRDKAGWTASTTCLYWTALMAGAKIVGVEVTYQMKATAKMYSFMAKEENPARPTVPATVDHIRETCEHLVTMGYPKLATAVLLCFTLGQRIGDTLKLQRQKVGSVYDQHSRTEFTTVQYVEGKTVRRRDPFTLHLPATSKIAVDLRALVSLSDQKTCFGEDRVFNASLIRTAIKKSCADLCLLSIRRGGLITMAQSGVSLQTLLHHSRHASEEMLMRYLGWGENFFLPARELVGGGFFNQPTDPNLTPSI